MLEDLLAFVFGLARGSLPADLPTVAEIYSSEEHLRPPAGQYVVKVNDWFVVKYGPNVNFQEGENLLFVQQQISIPVPRLYAMFRNEGTMENFIVMEYIKGVSLGSIWAGLDRYEKNHITSQLNQHLNQLRRHRSQGYIGGLRHQPMKTQYFIEWTKSAWAEGSEAIITSGRFMNQGDFYMRQIPQIFNGHAIVFIHGDPNRENILAMRDGTVVLIDWEYAGYLPSFWEYCMCLFTHEFDDDWHEAVAEFLEEWPTEYAWMKILTETIIWGLEKKSARKLGSDLAVGGFIEDMCAREAPAMIRG